jgi:GR25 family glycosyltransferase involved in LPS biosynthesis
MILNKISKNIYVINLPERIDRKTHIIGELNKIGCADYKIFPAINGNKELNPTHLKNGMYGLIKTYINIYEEWKNNKTGTITIIEDDCVFVNDFNEKSEIFYRSVPEDWEMLYFGGNHNNHMGVTTKNINENCLKLTYSFTAHCVILKDYVFEHLISEIINFNVENDVILANLQSVYNAYCSTEILANQIPNFSDIENRMVDYSDMIK